MLWAWLRRALHARLWETGVSRLGVSGLLGTRLWHALHAGRGHLGMHLGVHLRVAVRADRAGAEWIE